MGRKSLYNSEYIAKSVRYTATPADEEEPLWAKFAPEYLIALTGMRLSNMYIKDKNAGKIFMADVTRERAKLKQRHTSIMEARETVNAEN